MKAKTILILLAVSLVLSVSANANPDVEAYQSDGVVSLYWFVDAYYGTDMENCHYTVEYKMAGSDSWLSEEAGFTNEYQIVGLTEGGTYQFRVTALFPDQTMLTYECQDIVTVNSLLGLLDVGDGQSGDFDLEIKSFQNIPYSGGRFNFINVEVDSAGISWPYLDVDNFEVYEDGVLQTQNFAVIPPSDTNCVRPADIVFLIDNSGSMGGEIAAVRNNAIAFGDSLAALGIDYRLGAVRFGQSASSGNPLFYGPLTDDVSVFRSWIASMRASGGREPGLQTIIDAIGTFAFRPGSSRHFILITDEDSDGGSLASAINLCATNNITVHVRGNCGYASSQAHYCGPGGIGPQTGGTVESVTAPFWNILDNLETGICDNYLVRYKPLNDTCDGVPREVIVYTESGMHSDEDTVYYTPCMSPIITVTPDTRALELMPQLSAVPLTIQAWVVDNVSPFIQSVTLHYRTTTSSSYISVPMANLFDSLYSYVIPTSGVNPPGVDYYVTATDGESVASAPKVDPDISPYQIAVLPNTPPSIEHDTLGPYQPTNIDLAVAAVVMDTTLTLTRVELYFRQYGDLLFTMQPMTNDGGDNFVGTIPDYINAPGGCEYYIMAMDDFGLAAYHGDADNPHQINAWSGAPPHVCYDELPDPVLVFEGTEEYEANGQLFTRYLLTVTNWADYPDELFELSPDLPPCGLNDNASRSFVDIFEADGSRIYGFCGFQESTNLRNIWFAVPRGDCPPEQIYIEIDDRRCDINYTSNLVPIIGDITGTVSADCPAPGTGLLGVEIDLYNADGDLIANAITDVDGYYEMLCVLVGDCTITIVTPLGYQVPDDELSVTVIGNEVVTVDFALTCVEITAEPRTIGYWKHQTGVATGGKGRAQVDAATLCGYLDMVASHFNSNAVNQVIVYQPPSSGLCDDKLQVLKALMNLKGSVDMIDRAKQQLMALLLNVASGKLSQTEIISADGATVSQAITYSDNVIDDPAGNYETAKTIADEINNNRMVPAGMIPLSTVNIAYRLGLPIEFSLAQNYPNPFNPKTQIKFNLPLAGFVQLYVYNVVGQKVATVADGFYDAGIHVAEWDGSDVSSGVYFYRIETNTFSETKKMILLK